MSGMLSGRRAVVIVCGLLQVLVVFSLTSRFFVNSHLDHSRAWIPACSLTAALCTAAFPPIFLQLRKGPLWSCAELLQSYALCSSDQCRTVKLPQRLFAVRELFWGMLGRGDGGWRGIEVSGSGYNEVFALEVRTMVWLRQKEETCKPSSRWCDRCLLITKRPKTPSYYRYLIWVLSYIPYMGLNGVQFCDCSCHARFLCILRFRIFEIRVLNASE